MLHPQHGPGLAAALSKIPDLTLDEPTNESEVEAALAAGAKALVTFIWRDEYLDHELRWVQAISAGVDQFPLGMFRARNIVLTSARGAHSPSVADHAVALLLALLRNIGVSVRQGIERIWRPGVAYETEGLRVGIVGLGSIGEAIAVRLLGLGMNVAGCKRNPENYNGAVRDIVGQDQLLDLFARCDAVVVALPSSPETERLIRAEHLAALGTGWFVNVGRGDVVDEDALIVALRSGQLRGAGLDVTQNEPLAADSPLWDLPNVIVTPHMGWSSQRLSGRLAKLVEANLSAFTGVGPWVNLVT